MDLTLRRVHRFSPSPFTCLTDSCLVIFDFETTGLDPQIDRIIEVGAIRVLGGEIQDEFSYLIDPEMELPEKIIEITGITDAMLQGQPKIDQILPRFLEFIQGSILVAHNADFDMAFLQNACSRVGIDLEWPAFCTLKMARALLKEVERRDLDTLAEYYGLTFESRHRSIGDVKVTGAVLQNMLRKEACEVQHWDEVTPFRSGNFS